MGTEAVDAALRLLTHRARSRDEVRRHLERRGFAAAEVGAALDRLEGMAYLDDREFARTWVIERIRLKRLGPRRLRAELVKKGIAQEIIDLALSEAFPEGEEELARSAADAWIEKRRVAGLDLQNDPGARRRLFAYLARRGFTSGVIEENMRRLTES